MWNRLKPLLYNSMFGFVPIVIFSVLTLFTSVALALACAYIVSVGLIVAGSVFLIRNRIFQFTIPLSFFILSLFSIFPHVLENEVYTRTPIFFLELLWAATLILVLCFKENVFQFVNLNFKPTVRADIRGYMIQLYHLIPVILVFLLIHFGVAILYLIFIPSYYNPTWGFILFYYVPIGIMFFLILYEQVRVYFYLRENNKERFVYVVDENGLGIGKILYSDAVKPTNVYRNPCVRIAFVQNEMIYLSKRPCNSAHDPNRIDIAIGDYINYGESLNSAINRLLEPTNVDPNRVQIIYRHHTLAEIDNRMLFLSVVFLDDDFKLMMSKGCECIGKYWTLQQIDNEMESNIFSPAFIEEYPKLQKEMAEIKKRKYPSIDKLLV